SAFPYGETSLGALYSMRPTKAQVVVDRVPSARPFLSQTCPGCPTSTAPSGPAAAARKPVGFDCVPPPSTALIGSTLYSLSPTFIVRPPSVMTSSPLPPSPSHSHAMRT